MGANPETTFIRSIHAHLKGKVFFQKMCNPFISGIPDVWYSGPKNDLWVEYKYIHSVPKRATVLPNLSERQKVWLNDRLREGRNVAVILGVPDGGVLYRNKEWMEALQPGAFEARVQSRKELAQWIQDQVRSPGDDYETPF